jgi:hypothetical protein
MPANVWPTTFHLSSFTPFLNLTSSPHSADNFGKGSISIVSAAKSKNTLGFDELTRKECYINRVRSTRTANNGIFDTHGLASAGWQRYKGRIGRKKKQKREGEQRNLKMWTKKQDKKETLYSALYSAPDRWCRA